MPTFKELITCRIKYEEKRKGKKEGKERKKGKLFQVNMYL